MTGKPAEAMRRAAQRLRSMAGEEALAEYIAAIGPQFAESVASWLDDEAERVMQIDGYEDSAAYPVMAAGFRHPLAVTRAFLGDNQEAP